MERIIKSIFVACLMAVCGTALRSSGMVDDTEYLPDNAPDGAVEFFENQDGTESITLFEDSLVAKGKFIGTNEISIPVADITKVSRHGTTMKIRSKDGAEIGFSLDFFSRKQSIDFTETLEQMVKDAHGGHS